MSTLTYLTSLVQQAISRLNNYEANAKKVDELPHQTTLEPTSKLPVSRGGISEHVTVQQIISSIQNSNYNQLLAIGTISVSGTDITVPSGVSGQINGALYGTSTDTTIPITLCPAGFTRKDILVLTTSNTVIAISGEETDGAIVLAPPTPLDTIYITEFDVNDTVIGTPGDPIVGTQFKQKNESQKFTQVLGGTNAVIDLQTFGQQYYVVVGSVTSIAGFSKALLTATPTAEVPYGGKDFYFENKTDHDITLKNAFSPVDIPFNLGADLIVPTNGIVWLKYDATAETLALFFKSWTNVKEVIEGYFNGANFYTDAGFTNLITPESSKIYLNLAVTPATQYRWSGSTYVQIGGADFLKKDIATYPIASFPLADTDKLILFQGGVPKKIDKSDIHKETTITVELMNNLTSDFYAPNDLIIHSTDIIRGSGTITLKVENVAYTIGQLITRGNKITVETTTPSVYNLNTTPTNTSWQRPADWLPMPTNITSADQTFVGLHAVIENSDNYCAFSFTTSAGQYQVDWGDGNVTLHNSNTIAQHQYNYATISNSTLSSRGYKQAMVKVTAVSGNLLTCNFQQRFVTTPTQNQPYSSGFLECILSMPNASSGQSIIFGGTTIRHAYCEKVEIKTIGNATNLASVFYNFHSLQSIPLFNTINVTNMTSMFTNCNSLQSVPLFNTINVTNMSTMFYLCYSLQSLPLFNTINVNNMATMLQNCFSLKSVPFFNTISVTNMSGMFIGCYSLNFIPAFVTTAMTTDFINFATGCSSLNRILMSFNRTVSLVNCQLSKDALVEIFTNLANRTSTTSATIDITGNWGASALSASDRLIAINKNWVITG